MALHCDTDSVIYIKPDDQPPLIETGDCLVAMTSELKQGFHIDEFVSGGPKNYASRTINLATGENDSVCKIHGITLNYSSSRLVNFDVMRDLILGGNESERVTFHTDHKIKRKSAGGRMDIITEPEDKLYRISFFKRRRLADNLSVPFGYISER
jgi:hypothetical protein